MPEAVIVSAARTPIGRASKGALKAIRADDMGAVAIRGALSRIPAFDYTTIEDVIVGCAFPEGEQGMNLARILTGLAGLPVTAGAVTVNRFCASSLQAVNMAAQSVMLGQGDVIVVGGVENMSRVPMGGFNPSFNPKLANNPNGVEACGAPAGIMTTVFEQSYIPMGLTAENLAKKYSISREDQDRFALQSHQRALAAQDAGIHAKEIVPVTLPDGTVVSVDEGPRRDTSLERLATLEPAFIAGGTVTAGNSSPLNDGASSVIVMSREKAQELGLRPRARILAMAVAGVEPEYMGIGPVPAVRKALKRANLTLGDIDLIELNEAFAAQSLAVIRELGLDEAKVNPHGGAIALGHPLGCTGARIAGALVNDLETLDKRLGIATLCVGGGQGVATIIERL
jgi:acetyl-CoA acetyltransferase family protein